MREIVLDTETTGLDPGEGHRLVEVAGVELHNRVATGRTFHAYINPRRDVPEDAFRVHGLSTEFLAKQPVFTDVVDDFLGFIADSPLVIHNAEFDIRFINSELERVGRDRLLCERAVDTLALARAKHPGASNSLDALCARYRIDASRRVKHGALVDAQILAEVYGELTGGRQSALILMEDYGARGENQVLVPVKIALRPLTLFLDSDELAAHLSFVETLGSSAVWREYAMAAV